MKNSTRNWKTTLLGLAALAISVGNAIQKPALFSDPATVAQISAGIGLIAAKDGDKDGTPAA